MTHVQHFAIVGGGIAGITCARNLVQAGHRVTVFEKSIGAGGRMATRPSAFGSFDHGAQYFTVRDARFTQAIDATPGLCKTWSANNVQVLDEHGVVIATGMPASEPHWVATPGMNALVRHWAQPLIDSKSLELQTRVTHIERDSLDAKRWQLRTTGVDDSQHVFSGFDSVLLALPAPQARELLQNSKQAAELISEMSDVEMTPCLTLMLAFPQAMQPGLGTLGPQWNAARSTHHRIAWLARESSKPGRETIERWTVQASAAWSAQHLQDDNARIEGKLHKAFTEVTGIHAEPTEMQSHRWLYAQASVPLGKSHLWDTKNRIGVCGDWCIGHRVEDGFVSGLELALAVL